MTYYGANWYNVVFSQTASVTVANTGTETNLVSTGIGSATLPAHFLTVGRTIRVTAMGYLQTKAAPVGGLTLRVRINGIAGAIVLENNGADPTASLSTDRLWQITGLITCRTTGATGTVFAQGQFTIHTVSGPTGAEQVDQMNNSATVTVDTRGTREITVSCDWVTADVANTLTCTNILIEALG